MTELKRALFVGGGMQTEISALNYAGYDVHNVNADGAIALLCNEKEDIEGSKEFDIIISRMYMPSGYELESEKETAGASLAKHLQDHDVKTPFIIYDLKDCLSNFTYEGAGFINLMNGLKVPVMSIEPPIPLNSDEFLTCIENILDFYRQKVNRQESDKHESKKQVLFVVHGDHDKYVDEIREFRSNGYDVCFAGNRTTFPVNDAIDRIVYGGEKFDIIVSEIALDCNNRHLRPKDTLDGYNTGPAFAAYLYDLDIDIPFILYSEPNFLKTCNKASYDARRDVVTLLNGAEISFVLKGCYGSLINKANDLLSEDSGTLELDFAELTF